jgi:hypothetical protein
MSSYLIVTQTEVDEQAFQRHIVGSWLRNWKSGTAATPKELEEVFNHKNAQSLNFKTKDEFRKSISSLYEVNSKPTVIFLGDLNTYSMPLQEGMLRILEEPPHNVDFIVRVSDISVVLPTIISRCHVQYLNFKEVCTMLPADRVERVKKYLPLAQQTSKDLITNQFSAPVLDKKLEREDIDFWLWQLQVNVYTFFKNKPQKGLAQILFNIQKARQLNQQNVQKRFVVEILN